MAMRFRPHLATFSTSHAVRSRSARDREPSGPPSLRRIRIPPNCSGNAYSRDRHPEVGAAEERLELNAKCAQGLISALFAIKHTNCVLDDEPGPP
jgi:hypothetical protein